MALGAKMKEQEVSGLRHTEAILRLGFWAPVYGNWIVSKERDLQNASFDYTRQLTLLAEDIGFATVLLAEHTFNPFDPAADQLDAWTTAAGLATITRHIELMPAVRPAFKHPVVVAKMAGSIDHMSGGRAALNLVSGWWQRECEMMGLPAMPHDERYQRSEEFLTILKGLWTQQHFSFGGRYYQLSDVTLAPLPVRQPGRQALRCEEAIPGVDRQVVMIRTYAYAHGYVGSNGGTAAGLVGTPRDIAERLTEFRDIGVTTVLLQFHPMREEMARFGEQVVPLLAQAGIWRHPCRQGGRHNGHNGGVL